MKYEKSAFGGAVSPAGRSSSTAPRGCPPGRSPGGHILTWALHGPPWTYMALALTGLLAALLLAGFIG
jgi:hypothetical protein